MSLISVKGHVEYHWRDKRALQTFEQLGVSISEIWKSTAHEARGRTPEQVENLRRQARLAASPLVRQASRLRAMYARPEDDGV